MFLGSILIMVSSISVSSAEGGPFANYGLSERTENIILSEALLRSQEGNSRLTNNQMIELDDSLFLSGDLEWTLSSDTYYWNSKWSYYNCYSFAIQRYDITPDYFLNPDQSNNSDNYRWYVPGMFSHFVFDENFVMSIQNLSGVVVADLEAIGFTNVSASDFNGSMPTLGANEELIALRLTPPENSFDFHFMRYNKSDGFWYHKPSSGAVLQYNHSLSESVDWENEGFTSNGSFFDGIFYSGDIWLIRYTPQVLSPTLNGPSVTEAVYCDYYYDNVVAVDVPFAGDLYISFYNINGFSATLYDSDWDFVDSVTYDPIEVYANPGRYYLIMKNYRSVHYVYATASLSSSTRGLEEHSYDDSILISEGDRLVRVRFVDDGSVDLSYASPDIDNPPRC